MYKPNHPWPSSTFKSGVLGKVETLTPLLAQSTLDAANRAKSSLGQVVAVELKLLLDHNV